jgi:hypothetical protein
MTEIVPRTPGWMTPRYLARRLTRRHRWADPAPLLDRLPPVEYQPTADEDQLFDQEPIGQVLLPLLKIDQESEYLLCRRLAEHALGHVPEPADLAEDPD